MTTSKREEIDNVWHAFFAQACRAVPYRSGMDPRTMSIARQEFLMDSLIQEILDLRKKEQDNG